MLSDLQMDGASANGLGSGEGGTKTHRVNALLAVGVAAVRGHGVLVDHTAHGHAGGVRRAVSAGVPSGIVGARGARSLLGALNGDV